MPDPDVERRIISVLFCDLVGFTSLSEALDAEDVSIVQDSYFAEVKEALSRYGGAVEKFIGDAAVGVFGVPVARDDDAERAVRAGFAIVGAVEQLGARLGLEEGALRVRVGVNTGEAVVHPDPAPGEAMVTGDTVNTAARLQSAAQPGGVLVGPTTALAVAEAIELEDAGELELMGKAEPLRASIAVSVRPERSRELAMGVLRAPTLGRDAELEALRTALGGVRGGSSARWLLVAPPGTGKTRVVAEFSARARQAGPHIRSARLPSDVVGPYQAVAQLFVSALSTAGPGTGADDEIGARRRAADEILTRHLAEAGVSPGRSEVVRAEALDVTWPPTEAHARSGDREARFAAWLEALDALARDVVDVWIVEDLHWSGADLLAFLDAAIGTDTRRLVIATTRPSLLEAAPAWCAEGAERRTLHLPQLAPTDAGQLVESLVGDALPDYLVDGIVLRSDGNPLFIEELIRSWVSIGVLAPSDGAWSLTAPVEQVSLPATVQSIYAAQLDDLPATERRLARRASVAGRRFPVAALGQLDIVDAGPSLAALVRRALLMGPEADTFVGETYAFRHALLRDAGYASLARAERARLHVRLARWIEELAGDRWPPLAEMIAGHYAAALDAMPALASEIDEGLGRAEVQVRAADWFHRSGRAALTLSAFDTARSLLRRSVELTPDDRPTDLAQRLTALGRATASAADTDEAASLHRQAMAAARGAMADETLDPADRSIAREAYATAAGALGEVFGQQVRFDDMLALAEEVLAEIGDTGRDDLAVARILVLRARARGLMSEAEARLSAEDVERAYATARDAGDPDLELDARFERFWLGVQTMWDVDLTEIEEIERLAARIGRWDRAMEAARMQANLLLPDDAGGSLARVQHLAELSEAHGITEGLAWADYHRTEALFESGDWDEGVRAADRALDLSERHAYHRAAVRTWFLRLPMAWHRGEAETIALGDRWFESHDTHLPDSPYSRVMRGGIDAIRTWAGHAEMPIPDVDHVREGLQEGVQHPSWFLAVDLLFRRWLSPGGLEDAEAALGVLDATAELRPYRLDACVRGLERAWVGIAAGADASEIGETARRAAETARDLGAPYWLGRALAALQAAGSATDAECEEAASVDHRLGLARPLV